MCVEETCIEGRKCKFSQALEAQAVQSQAIPHLGAGEAVCCICREFSCSDCFPQEKAPSLAYHPTEISALSNLFQFPNHNFSLKARSSEMSGCALCLCYPHSTPSPSSSHPGDASLQAVTQTTAYFRNINTTTISKHLEFKIQVFLKNLVTCMKQLRNKEVNRS